MLSNISYLLQTVWCLGDGGSIKEENTIQQSLIITILLG